MNEKSVGAGGQVGKTGYCNSFRLKLVSKRLNPFILPRETHYINNAFVRPNDHIGRKIHEYHEKE
jgi:hypothetical protein